MKSFCHVCLALVFFPALLHAADPLPPRVILGLHGGLAVDKKDMTPELEKGLRAGMEQALKAGQAVLQKPGATSLDAVEAAIRVLEDSPWFNAGKGAVFTHEGKNELDASIMDGKTKKAGAVAGVTTIKNPITAARAVMEKTKHVLLISRGAEVFAEKAGLEIVDPKYFWTERRWKQLQDQLQKEREAAGKKEGAALDHKADLQSAANNEKRVAGAGPTGSPGVVGRVSGSSVPAGDSSGRAGRLVLPDQDGRTKDPPYEKLPHFSWGTVGAVALDKAGNLAAGTSTGGMSNKQYGRVGDSPIIAAGTYAENESCAVSCTGHGEFFIRFVVSYDIVALKKYKNLTIQQAADEVIQKKLKPIDGEGGVIVLDRQGNLATSFNCEGMVRGYVTEDGKMKVMIYEE